MKVIKHRFLDHKINPETEILILGTFNPDTEKNKADFFYGRGHNYLWQILSEIYEIDNLKFASKKEKIDFIQDKKIDFIDLIAKVEVEDGKENYYKDNYIDNKVIQWNDIIEKISKLKSLQKIGFTRKTFSDIPNIRKQIEGIELYCKQNNIIFKYLTTPSRHPNYYGRDKYIEWFNLFKND